MNISLLYPWALGVIAIYLIALYLLKRFRVSTLFGNFKALERLKKRAKDIDSLLYLLIVILLSISLSTPIKRDFEVVKETKGKEIVLLLDASNSMREDSRFKRAKEILKEFIKSRADDRFALIVFGDRAFIASPMSSDKELLNKTIDYLKAGVAGGRDTALYEALYLSNSLFDKGVRDKRVILLTDGIDTVGSIPLEAVVERLKEKNIKVYTVGIGSDYKKEILYKIAKSSKGVSFDAKSSKSLEAIFKQISNIERDNQIYIKRDIIKPIYKPLLILSIVLLIIVTIRSREKILILSILLLITALLYPIEYQNIKSNPKDRVLTILLDISQSMLTKDIYPNRERVAINRVKDTIDTINSYKISLLLFGKGVYLLSPPTSDKDSLKLKIDRLKIPNSYRRGSRLDLALKAIPKSSKILIISDATYRDSLDRAIKIAKDIKAPIYLYITASSRGGAIPNIDGYIEDSSGVVISRINPNIYKIATLYANYEDGESAWKRVLLDIENKKNSIKSFAKFNNIVVLILILISLITIMISRFKKVAI